MELNTAPAWIAPAELLPTIGESEYAAIVVFTRSHGDDVDVLDESDDTEGHALAKQLAKELQYGFDSANIAGHFQTLAIGAPGGALSSLLAAVPLQALRDELQRRESGETTAPAVEINETTTDAPGVRWVTFRGQAWINGHTMDVDDSEARYSVTAQEWEDAGGDDASEYDALSGAANAPEWVRNWAGPFEVYPDDEE